MNTRTEFMEAPVSSPLWGHVADGCRLQHGLAKALEVCGSTAAGKISMGLLRFMFRGFARSAVSGVCVTQLGTFMEQLFCVHRELGQPWNCQDRRWMELMVHLECESDVV